MPHTVNPEKFAAWKFRGYVEADVFAAFKLRGFQRFYYIKLRFRGILISRQSLYRENREIKMHAKFSCFTVYLTGANAFVRNFWILASNQLEIFANRVGRKDVKN